MRIVIDMQGAQGTNKDRGIGRYAMAFVQALVRAGARHEIVLALNGAFPQTIESIRAAFNGLLPQENLRVWQAPLPVTHDDPANDARRRRAEQIYEAFLAQQCPDFICVTSLFEGLGDDVTTSVHTFQSDLPVAVILYDLIPFMHPARYLTALGVKRFYAEKLEHLKRADLCLAISESSRQEGITQLGLPEKCLVNISTDADPQFRKITISTSDESALRQRYGLTRPFVMYTGGIDYRKNIEGLIRAYSCLPGVLRSQHQLAVVCAAQPQEQKQLQGLANAQGLAPGELVLTGRVPDADLVALYNLCRLFVFPSWHEGFGLPALEAMRCGAPVIGANTSSLPEVIGWDEALFDPHSDQSITQAMLRGLTDETWRAALIQHGHEQAQRFSWDETGRRAIEAMECWHADHPQGSRHQSTTTSKPKLAYVSPLPPARSGIADYSAELLPQLSKYYDVDVIVHQDKPVTDEWILAHCPIRSMDWLQRHSRDYERILYHFGNSSFHEHMFRMLKSLPGVVVLHDFYLSGIQQYREALGLTPGAWTQALYESHGYGAVRARFQSGNTRDVVFRHPTNLQVLQRATGVIVHSEQARTLARRWYGANASVNWSIIPHLRSEPRRDEPDRASARNALGIGDDDLLVCSFGVLGPIKLNHRLLQAWLTSPLCTDPRAYLVFVGAGDGDYADALRQSIGRSGAESRIRITGWADGKAFRRYLAAADIGVQLRTQSRGETSGTVLDCMNHGVATIVNAHGSMAELDRESVWMLPDQFEDTALADALFTLARDPERRAALGAKAVRYVRDHHAPEACARRYFDAIEAHYHRAQTGLQGLIPKLVESGYDKDETVSLANALAATFPPAPRVKQLLVDVSELVQRDVKSGIQRVVHAVLREWLQHPPEDYRVEPVYATAERPGYRYARKFTCAFFGIPSAWATDEPVDAWAGDFFIGLDLNPVVTCAQENHLVGWRGRGVQVWFVVYDLLLILSPEYFFEGGKSQYERWLKAVARFDGLMCISYAVADEVRDWIATHGDVRVRPLTIDWFHLGADILASTPTQGLPADAPSTLEALRGRPSFLMVGTIEPRKAHKQVLDAFEAVWRTGTDVNLVIVGKQGWLVEKLAARLQSHPELSKRLYWLEGISDEYLEAVYSACTCLIAASYGEGFGLPLIEAAQHKLPIIARDIPVFREVAGEYAYYFRAEQPSELAQALFDWLDLYRKGEHPRSDRMPWLTWKESANMLLEKIRALLSSEDRRRESRADGAVLTYGPAYTAEPSSESKNHSLESTE